MTSMRPLIVIRRTPKIDFMRWHVYGLAFSLLLTALTVGIFLTAGLNYGIDFTGGTLIEVRSTTGRPISPRCGRNSRRCTWASRRCRNSAAPTDVLIRLPQQPGGDAAQMKAVQQVRDALGPGIDYRRVEVVGPSVGSELIRAGVLATVLALGAILLYIWFRFEWQFGVGATLSTLHDVVTTVGLFAIFQLEFNLTTLAAILTIAGYSVNDTVVIYDRVRESMRKYRTMPFRDLINLALNETLSRTILTVSTVALAVLALLFFGGEVLRGFSIAMLWGIVIGTYSSLFIAAPMLYYVQPNRRAIARERRHGRAAPAERASRPDAGMELTRRCRPGGRSSSAMAPTGSASAASSIRPGAGVPRPDGRLGEAAMTGRPCSGRRARRGRIAAARARPAHVAGRGRRCAPR